MFQYKKQITGALLAVATATCSSMVSASIGVAGFFFEDEDEGVFHISIEGNDLATF